MKIATSLTLLAIGAILTFAITSHPSFLNLQVAGLIVMAVGVAGLVIPRRGQGWLRRRTVLRKGNGGPVTGQVDETRYPPYVMINPDADPEQAAGPEPGDLTAEIPDVPDPRPAPQEVPPGTAAAQTEVVEEYRQE
ncbi:MAG TPA: hypothetical protein VH637_01570 [Streptosporangiaceae bacterium]|jgi:hypothetical protein